MEAMPVAIVADIQCQRNDVPTVQSSLDESEVVAAGVLGVLSQGTKFVPIGIQKKTRRVDRYELSGVRVRPREMGVRMY